jgi:hypothetical protein
MGPLRTGILCVGWIAGSVLAVPAPEFTSAQKEQMIANVRGTFDMARNPRPYIVYLILDQTNNVYPSFWCGRNLEGTVGFEGRVDFLDGKVYVKQTGKFTVQLTHAARKLGMFEELPAGEWVEGLRDLNFRIAFDGFRNPVLTGIKAGSGGSRSSPENIVTVEATCSGSVSVGERTAPFTGAATLGFSDRTPVFSLCARFPFPGAELGLVGLKGEGIAATLYTASAPTTNKPDVKKDATEVDVPLKDTIGDPSLP